MSRKITEYFASNRNKNQNTTSSSVGENSDAGTQGKVLYKDRIKTASETRCETEFIALLNVKRSKVMSEYKYREHINFSVISHEHRGVFRLFGERTENRKESDGKCIPLVMKGCCGGRVESKSRANCAKTIATTTPLGMWSVRSSLKRKRQEYEHDNDEIDIEGDQTDAKLALLDKVLSTEHFAYSAYSPYNEIPQIVIHIFSPEGLRKHRAFLKAEWNKHEVQFSVHIGDIVGGATTNSGRDNTQSPHILQPSEFEVYLNGDRVDSAKFVRDLRHRIIV